MLFDACCKYCCLLQSTAFTFAALWHFWMQISGDKTIQFLTQQYMFANVLVSLEGLRSAPAQCQKRFVVLRAQSFWLWHLHGTAALVHDDVYHMAVPITWQCGGQPCHQHGRQINFKRMARFAKSSRCGKTSSFSQKLATGLQSMAPASNAGSSTICFYA